MPWTFVAGYRPYLGYGDGSDIPGYYISNSKNPHYRIHHSNTTPYDDSTYYLNGPSNNYVTDFKWKLHSSAYTSIDDGYGTNTVPFFTGSNFYMNGTAYSSYYIGTNGIITFNAGSSSSVVPGGSSGIQLNGADLWLNPGAQLNLTNNMQNVFFQNLYFTLNGVTHLKHTGIIYYGTYNNVTQDRSVMYVLTRHGSIQHICAMVRPEAVVSGSTMKPVVASGAAITGVTPTRGVGYTWRSTDNGANWSYLGEGWVTFSSPTLDLTSGANVSIKTLPLRTFSYPSPIDEGTTGSYKGVTGTGSYTWVNSGYHPALDYNLKPVISSVQQTLYGVLFRIAAFNQSARNTWEAYVNNSIDSVSGTAWKFLVAGGSGISQAIFAQNFLGQYSTNVDIPTSNLAVQKLGRLMESAKSQADYSTWVSAGYILANAASGQEWRMSTDLFYDNISAVNGNSNTSATNSYYYLTANNIVSSDAGTAMYNAVYVPPNRRKFGYNESASPISGQVSFSSWNGHHPIGSLQSVGRSAQGNQSVFRNMRYGYLYSANVAGANTTLQFSNTTGGADATNISLTLDGGISNNGLVLSYYIQPSGTLTYAVGSGTSAVTTPTNFLAAGSKTDEFAAYVSVRFVGTITKTNSNVTIRVVDATYGDVAAGSFTSNWVPLDRTRNISIYTQIISNTGVNNGWVNGVCNTTISGTLNLRNNLNNTTISRSFYMRLSGV